MLARVPPNFQFNWNPPLLFPIPQNCKCIGRIKLSKEYGPIRAGYTRTPLETSGAYQLVDDETGEKIIVWGGIDDDSPIPSKDDLSWKPTQSKHPVNHHGDKGTPPASISPASHATRLAGNFSRLKAHKVKALLGKASKIKEELSVHDAEQIVKSTSDHGSVNSYSRKEFKEGKRDTPSIRLGGGNLKASLSDNVSDVDATQNIGRGKAKNYANKTVNDCTDELSEQKFTQKQDNIIVKSSASASPVSSPHLKGWGYGMRTHKQADSFKKYPKPSADSSFFSRRSFKDIGCSDFMMESLRCQQFSRPSHIQALAFAPVLEGKCCILADQSGSGKTLAYLVPLIQRLRQEELHDFSKSSSQSPRVVILAPTAELASQVLSNCRSISKSGVPFHSVVVTGGFRQRTQMENLQHDVDVLIATPGRFIFLVREKFLQLENLRCVVLDEVDILFKDGEFEEALQVLINESPITTQYLFVTATLPVDIYNKLVELFPDCKVILGPGMHRTSPGLEEVLVDCSGDDGTEKTPETAFLNKRSALVHLVQERSVPKTIVFCNKIETCRKVENILKRLDRRGSRIRTIPFHAAVAQEFRLANMKEFLGSTTEASLFLVSTDRSSRGIDFAGVDHVILFDFPRDPSEYVRRVGRTARGAGGEGKAFIFAVGKQVPLARKIMERNLKGHPVHDVPCSFMA